MDNLIQFRPRARDAVEIKNVRRIWPPDDPAVFAMDDDNSPSERNPDPPDNDAA